MERDINLDEISDGKLYETNDLVKLGCGDCAGCSACCHEMGDTIILDPYDIWQLTGNLHCTFEQLMGEGKIALSVYDGVILPHLRLEGPQEGCLFLNEAGRCSIHPFRPGMCRLFPLGRIYGEESFRYFLQVHECRKESRTKVKIKKWLDIPEIRRYEQFLSHWHFFVKSVQEEIIASGGDEAFIRQRVMQLLQTYYLTPYSGTDDFYEHYYTRWES